MSKKVCCVDISFARDNFKSCNSFSETDDPVWVWCMYRVPRTEECVCSGKPSESASTIEELIEKRSMR